MKRMMFAAVLLTAGLSSAFAQDKPYRVVFDLTAADSMNQAALTAMMKEIAATSPDAEMEVVMYGKGFELVMPDKSKNLSAVKAVMENPKVSFKVCEIAMKKHNVTPGMLLKGVEPVPDGVKELVMKQQEGWGYIKVIR